MKLAVFLLFLLWPVVGLAEDLTPPRDMKHPVTGEAGTWIPRWLEREHVLIDQALEAARDDIRTLETTLREHKLEIAELREAIVACQRSEDHLVLVIQHQEKELQAARPRLERRARALWVTSSALVTALFLGAIGIYAW